MELLYDEVISFYDEKAFSWWIGPDSKPEGLTSFIRERGSTYEDIYIGLVLPVKKTRSASSSEYEVCEVESEEGVRNYVEVSAKIWGYDEATVEHLVQQRLNYVSEEDRRGGLLIVLDGDKPVGHAGYRLSSDGVAMYLAGSGVLPEYRRQGIYQALLAKRTEIASSNGCEYKVTQARKDNS